MEVVNAFNPSSGRQDQPGLYSERQVSQSYIVRPVLRKNKSKIILNMNTQMTRQ